MDRTVERLVCTTVGDCAWRLFFLVFTTVADDGVGTCGSCLNHCLGLWMLPFLVFTTMADDGVGNCGSCMNPCLGLWMLPFLVFTTVAVDMIFV